MAKIGIKQINNSPAAEGSIVVYDGNKNAWTNSSTNSVLMPSGTTLQRPAIPVNGHIRYDTDLNQFDFYENGIWRTFSNSGEINIAANVGTGIGIFRDKTGVTLNYRSIIGGANITATQNANDITLDVTGIPTIINDLTDVDTTTSSPTVGQTLQWNGTNWVPLTPPTSSNIFGGEYHSAESEILSTTNSSSWIQKLKLTTISIPAGTYRIGWSYQWNHDRTKNDFEGQVQIDDVITIMFHKQEPKDSSGSGGSSGTDQAFQLAGFKNIILTSGIHNIDIDYRTSSAGDESSIWSARLELWRIS